MKNLFLFIGFLLFTAFIQAQSVNPFNSGSEANIVQENEKLSMDDTLTSSCGIRMRLTDPILTKINLEKEETFTFKLLVDSLGNVVEITKLTSKTTCKDEQSIHTVMQAIQEGVKYQKKPGSEPEMIILSIKIEA